MKIVKSDGKYMIFGDSLETHENFPAKIYSLRFSKMTGFFLEEHKEVEVLEEKIYGPHEKKVSKILKAYDSFDRNLGIILSGKKGMGKTLCAKLLTIEAVNKGLPVILVDSYYPGIADFIESIEQEVVVLFDEFEKTFKSGRDFDPQDEMLTLFDGLSTGKKMFVITCNKVSKLNDYLINRPGRFHYHFRFDSPTDEEVSEYLKDKLKEEYQKEIESVVSFSRKVDLNFDCFRAISTELNMGFSFKEAINDLNIINLSNEAYSVEMILKNGESIESLVLMNMFANLENINFADGDIDVTISFNPKDFIYEDGYYVLTPDKVVKSHFYTYPGDREENSSEPKMIDLFEKVIIQKKKADSMRYHV